MFQPKSRHCLGDSLRENDHGVGYDQVLENQMGTPHPAFGVEKEQVMVKKKEMTHNSNYHQ